METVWYALLGLVFATYFTLGGYDYGVAMLARAVGRDEAQRQAVRNAVGPFFLGNEVWLVAGAGILIGAFPRLEGELFAGLYPLIVPAVLGVVTVTAAFQLRGRAKTTGARWLWDALMVGGGGLAALSWGAVLGGLSQGVPVDAVGHVSTVANMVTPYVVICGVTVAVLFAAHGATFLAMRMTGPAADRALAVARRCAPAAAVGVVVAVVAGVLSSDVRATIRSPLTAGLLAALLVGVLVAAYLLLGRRRMRLAFAATAVAAALPVFVVGAATYPYALVSAVDSGASVTVAAAAAGPTTLRVLSVLALPATVTIVGFQVMCWWAFRHRGDRRVPLFY